MKLNCPQCKTGFEFDRQFSVDDAVCPSCLTKVSLIDLLTISFSSEGDINGGQTPAYGDLNPGDVLSHFRLIRQLGQGGFGTVFEAYDSRLDRNVAVKVPRMSQLTRRQADIFIREARAAAQLHVPNIVSVFEVGRENDRIFIVSELVQGVTLGRWARQNLPDQFAAATIVSKLANAIHQAHDVGVIHRDLKPGNVLIDVKNEPHITDFGLAKRFDSEEPSLSRPGAVVGTPAYMSPEQASGKADNADRRTDVYALGVMFYELLTRERPFFQTEGSDVFVDIQKGTFKTPRGLNPNISQDAEAVCLKAMALSPGDRYATSAEFADDLDRLVERRAVVARPVGLLQNGAYLISRNRANASFAGLGFVLLAFIVVNLLRPDAPNRVGDLGPDLAKAVLMDVEFSVKPVDAEVTFARIDTEQGKVDFSKLQKSERQSLPGWRKIRLAPGVYLVQSTFQTGVHEAYRVIPASIKERQNRDYLITGWQTKEAEGSAIVLQPIEAHEKVAVESGVYQIGPEQLVLVKAGEFETGTDKVGRIIGRGRREPRIPKRLVAMPDYLIGQTEVTAKNFHDVMGRYPNEMKVEEGVQPDDVATNVSWLEAVDYCERIGARLPTYDEYLFAATNRGSTRFPFGDEFLLEDWTISTTKTPQLDVTQTMPPIYNLYSSVGEWAWDINVNKDAMPRGQMPDSRLATTWDGRLVLGIPPESPEKIPDMDESIGYGPSFFLDNVLHSAKIQNGFRVGMGLKNTSTPLGTQTSQLQK